MTPGDPLAGDRPREPDAGELRAGLSEAAAWLRSHGVPSPPLEGKLLRPAVAHALAREEGTRELGPEFWRGALAIQMVHEASLLHDDILDAAEVRRGLPSMVAQRGVGPALVLGDHYLTASYRAAAAAGSTGFMQVFVEAVERTVAGECDQARRCGQALDDTEYQAIIRGKSGELFGAAAALAGTVRGVELAEARELGCAIGSLYQMVDDFLDYCPGAATGKAAFQDYGQKKFTFVLKLAGIESFDLPAQEVFGRLSRREEGHPSVLDRALGRLEAQRNRVVHEAERLFGDATSLGALLDGWLEAARRGVATSTAEARQVVPSAEVRPSAQAQVADAARALGSPASWGAYFGHHSKSFRFSARLFPPEQRADIEGVYAFCRFTDDLVDEAEGTVAEVRELLEAWRELSRAAYQGDDVGIPLLDRVMGRARRAGAPFHYVDDLLTGVGMDLEPTDYRTVQELEVYTYRVAGVVGGWITELFGLHDPELLNRAYALGHGMQLTNILRDVGEDWRRGRLYLPSDTLAQLGVTREDVARVSESGEVDARWIDAMEHFMHLADRHYAAAEEAIPALPTYYRRPVAVAARVYRGIHDEIRRNGYDNGTRRAHTSLRRKLMLALGGLWRLRRGTPAALRDTGLELAH